jgi:polyhydroxyalkanoate synthesis regulator phasin
MGGRGDGARGSRSHERLLERVDAMVKAGRLTKWEAKRLRATGQPGEFDDVVREIRVRHARTRLDAVVQDGSLTREEADGFLERLRKGEHPRSLRARLHSLRTDVRTAEGPDGPAGTHGDALGDSPS